MKDIPRRLKTRKLIAATAFLLKQAPNQTMNIEELGMKLYMVERESLAETGSMITNDRFVALP